MPTFTAGKQWKADIPSQVPLTTEALVDGLSYFWNLKSISQNCSVKTFM